MLLKWFNLNLTHSSIKIYSGDEKLTQVVLFVDVFYLDFFLSRHSTLNKVIVKLLEMLFSNATFRQCIVNVNLENSKF